MIRPEAPRIESVDDIAMAVDARRWAFARDESVAIDRHWTKLCGQNPHLFNGQIFLNFERGIEERDGRRVLVGKAAAVDFKAFLAWRDFGFPDGAVCNCFAMAALQSADGAFILGRMSEKTANAGKIYFPSGTPDFGDVSNGALDLAGSVARELAEETGIAASEVDFAPGWTIVSAGPRIACMKPTRSSLAATEIVTRFQRFIAAQDEPELVALHPVYGLDDLDADRMPDFTLSYLRHALAAR